MSDWRTYATAARRRGADARAAADVYTRAAQRTARRQAPEVRDAVRRSRDDARRTAAAYTVVAGRRARRARLGQRLRNALRDALLVGVSLTVIWFVVTRTGVRIPLSAVLAVILVIMLLRFGYALLARTDTTVAEDNELDGGLGQRWDRSDPVRDETAARSHDPRRDRPRATP